MRVPFYAAAALLVAAPTALSQPLGPVHVGGELVMNQVDTDTGLGLSLTAQVRTRGPVSAYVALRPEVTSATEGGTGFTRTSDAYQPDGITPDYATSACRSVYSGEVVPDSRCGSNTVHAAIASEVGTRLAVGGGAILAGLGLRGGNGGGVYGALTGRLATPLYLRLEMGTGHASIGLGFGGL